MSRKWRGTYNLILLVSKRYDQTKLNIILYMSYFHILTPNISFFTTGFTSTISFFKSQYKIKFCRNYWNKLSIPLIKCIDEDYKRGRIVKYIDPYTFIYRFVFSNIKVNVLTNTQVYKKTLYVIKVFYSIHFEYMNF